MIGDNASYAERIFTGTIVFFQAFDIGDDINLEQLKQNCPILLRSYSLSKYFKNYHIPLKIDLPHPHTSSHFETASIHSFGVVSLTYKVNFEDTLENLRKKIAQLDTKFQEQSVTDAHSIFKTIKAHIKQPRFFHLRTSYVVIQVNPQHDLEPTLLKEQYGGIIADMLRFETEHLAEFQRSEMLNSAIGYYRGDLFIIDTHAGFFYDDDYQDGLNVVEFANIQQLELQYFDRMLDRQLNSVYQQQAHSVPFRFYLPLIKATKDPLEALNILQVDISVITERLKSSIKLAGEEYISDLYTLLVDRLDLANWKEGIEDKLAIIKDLSQVRQSKIDMRREDLLSVLIIVLIFIELIVGILQLIKH